MKVGILVTHIVVPMIASIGLYGYAFLSTHWNSFDKDFISHHNATNEQRVKLSSSSVLQAPADNDVPIDIQLIRYAFRSRYGLFGHCLDYKWINLVTIKPQTDSNEDLQFSPFSSCRKCNHSENKCPETGCCYKRCDHVPDCPSYSDEEGCSRSYNQTRYYWKEAHCMWQSLPLQIDDFPRYLSFQSTSEHDMHQHTKRLRHYLMLALFLLAPLLTLLALLIIFCINCVDRFYSIPFAFVSFFSFLSFLSGAAGLGLFFYEWIHERTYRPDYTYESNQSEALIMALNPWIVNVERFGIAFWIAVAAIGSSLLTTILSCCFCCGLQSEKSKFRIHVSNEKYAIIHTSPYDE